MADYNGSNTGAQVDAKLALAASALQPASGYALYPDTSATKLAGIEAGAQVNVAPVNILTSTSTTAALSAAQGKVLKDLIDTINTALTSDTSTLDTLQEIVDFIELNKASLDTLGISNIAGLANALAGKADASALGTAAAAAATDFATAAQGGKADTALQPVAGHALYPDTSAIKLAKTVVSDIAGITGSAAITNVVSLTTAQYTALGSKNATTVYLITDAT